jgi:FtsP/CotA-like multicopper oxidase with cupredoxin domain
MTPTLSRRGFLAATAAVAATSSLPRIANAQSKPLTLTAGTRTLDINGRAATTLGIVNGQGHPGLILDPGERFRVSLTNTLDAETILHWHGQIPPNIQDGVPNLPMPKLTSGETREYDFEPLAGTHWMHAHVPTQEMELLAGPLIVRTAANLAEDRQEVVMFLHDFSFNSAEEVLEEIRNAAPHDEEKNDVMSEMNSGASEEMEMDLNDYNFDAYLANDRTLSDPEVIQIENGGRIRLRAINAASATTFWIDTGDVEGRLVAVDGHDIEPVTGRRFGVAMAQRLDIVIDLPKGEKAFPILALREGEREQTGLVLATLEAQVQKIGLLANMASPAFDMNSSQEMNLRAVNPLDVRAPDKVDTIVLAGGMNPYVWTMNGRTWENHLPTTALSGQRVELSFQNKSMMGHPMHLHGHAFQVVGIGNKRFAGAVRDTIYVPPMTKVTVAIDAAEAAQWLLHCHHMPHLTAGMMSTFTVSAYT